MNPRPDASVTIKSVKYQVIKLAIIRHPGQRKNDYKGIIMARDKCFCVDLHLNITKLIIIDF